MKALQNNFTTPEQSKRLLELNVPADSADCYYEKLDVDMSCVEIRQDSFELKESLFYDDDYYPCWSVGRLQEIFKICYIGEPFQMWCNDDIFLPENLIDGMDLRIKEMDFSKLEE